MHIRRSKPINSERLKKDLDKTVSILNSGRFSKEIKKGILLVSCPICGDRDFKQLVEIYGFAYRECLSCRSAYVANPPSETDLSMAYRSDYYTSANKVLLANDSVIEYRVQQIAEPKVLFALEHLSNNKKSWLDVGCGVGEILSVVKSKGFETLGLEANIMEGQYAQKRFGLEVLNEYVTPNNLDRFKDRFGVVSLFSVLEHVLDPNSILRDIAQIQSEGDSLVVEVPHFPSISSLSQMTFPVQVNRMMHPPLHLFLFSTRSLEQLLGRHGYQIQALWYFGQDIYEVLSTLGLFAKELSGSVLHQGLAPLMNELQAVVDQHDLSDEMLVVAKKI